MSAWSANVLSLGGGPNKPFTTSCWHCWRRKNLLCSRGALPWRFLCRHLKRYLRPLPIGDDICSSCTVYLRLLRWEPLLHCGQDGSVQDFKWLPHTGLPYVEELGPGTPPAGLEAARQPRTSTFGIAQVAQPTGTATSPGMAQAAEVHLAAAPTGGGQGQAAASLAASAGAFSASSAGVDAGATHSHGTTAESKSVEAREHQAELQAH